MLNQLRLPLAGVLVALSACAHQAAVPEFDFDATRFAAVAAEYRTTHETRIDKRLERHETQWRMWRDGDRIVTETPAALTGEVWQRDGASIFHQKVFHADRRSVEFQTDDLRINNVPMSWSRQSLLIDPLLLKRLAPRNSGWRAGYPFRRYTGESDGSLWDVTIRTDLNVPVTIERKHDGILERTQLQSAYPLQSAPWSATPNDDYEVIDYADFGDRQSDPFVVKVQDQLGRPHAH